MSLRNSVSFHIYMLHSTHHLTQRHTHRMDASQILKHPFITGDPTLQNVRPSSKVPGVSGTSQSESSERITGICGPSLDQNANNRSRPLSKSALNPIHLDRRQVILGDISNRDMKKPNFCKRSLPARRVVSDPLSFKTPYCIAQEKPINSGSTLKDASLTKEKLPVLPATHDIALPFQKDILPDERPKKFKSNKNVNEIHTIPPPVSHAYCYLELFLYRSSSSQRTISLCCLLEQLAHSQ